MATQIIYTRNQLSFLLDAYLEGKAFPRMPGCPLWLGDKAGNLVPGGEANLWFQGVERQRPALLAVRTELDGAINYRNSDSDHLITAFGTREMVNRRELKQHLLYEARLRGLLTAPVYQLTEAKAHGETLARALDLSGWDSL